MQRPKNEHKKFLQKSIPVKYIILLTESSVKIAEKKLSNIRQTSLKTIRNIINKLVNKTISKAGVYNITCNKCKIYIGTIYIYIYIYIYVYIYIYISQMHLLYIGLKEGDILSYKWNKKYKKKKKQLLKATVIHLYQTAKQNRFYDILLLWSRSHWIFHLKVLETLYIRSLQPSAHRNRDCLLGLNVISLWPSVHLYYYPTP